MTKSIDKLNCVNTIGTFQSGDIAHIRTNVVCRPSETIQQPHHLESKFVDLRVCRGDRRCWSVEIVEMLKHRSLDIFCVQETRFRGKSVRMISGKAAEYKLFWIGNGKGLKEKEFSWPRNG